MDDFSVAQIQEDQKVLQEWPSSISFLNTNESDYVLRAQNGSEDIYSFSMINGSSNGSAEDPYVPYEQRPETYIVPVLFFIIFVIGVLGNGTLIAIFIRHRTMRSIPNL